MKGTLLIHMYTKYDMGIPINKMKAESFILHIRMRIKQLIYIIILVNWYKEENLMSSNFTKCYRIFFLIAYSLPWLKDAIWELIL